MGASLSTLNSTTQSPLPSPPDPTPIAFLSCYDAGKTTIIHHLVHGREKTANSSCHTSDLTTHILHYSSLSSYAYPPPLPPSSSPADPALILTPAPQPTPNHSLLQRTFSILEVPFIGLHFRRDWPLHMSESAATIFVIDSIMVGRDEYNLAEIRSELQSFSFYASLYCSHTDTVDRNGHIILILATKQDLQFGMSIAEHKNSLNLPKIGHDAGIIWRIQGVSGITGEGLCEAFDWLCTQLNAREPFVSHGHRNTTENFQRRCYCMRE